MNWFNRHAEVKSPNGVRTGQTLYELKLEQAMLSYKKKYEQATAGWDWWTAWTSFEKYSDLVAQRDELKRTAEMNATRIFALTESRNFYEAQCKEMTLRLARIRTALGDEK